MGVTRTFYIETFGCQMNAHDSEKVIGTLEHEGYLRVEDEADAGLILYNTCSIRDKAEQKVFHRLNEYKRLQGEGKKFAVLGCVAQQEGEKIFDRAPYVSLVSGSASYRNLPQMLVRLEAGEQRITGLDDWQTEWRPSTRSSRRGQIRIDRGYITIVEGCDKFCAYCVVPYTRGKERSRGSDSVLVEARRMADAGFTEIQLLGQNVNSYRDPSGKKTFAELLAAVGQIAGIRRVRFTTSHPRDFTQDIVAAIDATPTLCDHVHLPVQSGSTAVLREMAREYTRDWYLERISWIKAANREISITSDIIIGFPWRDRTGPRRHRDAAGRGRLRCGLRIQVFTPPEYTRDRQNGLNSGRGKVPALAGDSGSPARSSAQRVCSPSRPGDGSHGGGVQSPPSAGGRTQFAEQDGELYRRAADPAGNGKLPAGKDYADISQQPGG